MIVLFHRVNDAYPNDPLTVTNAKFEDFVRFFGRFYEVVTLSQLLDDLKDGKPLRNKLAITFDDGYRGNATMAAPILERHGQRACFFVTTGWMGTDHVAWWDAEKGIQTVWMNWDQVRGLKKAGHDIGSHTQTHPNLGEVPPDVARREIGGGSERLDAELGEHSGLFAYPFGGKKNMSAENQEVVNQLGLKCCLSAYGGTVRRGDDPLRLKRVTITNWFLSPYQFALEFTLGLLDPE
ncbi:MAG TPA: polysaccharide deacetylase family protein [Gemmatimonadaceae bacterium]|nr:polysaccharide deacetylase family protein [Gemmatimonadaceae bacterium]